MRDSFVVLISPPASSCQTLCLIAVWTKFDFVLSFLRQKIVATFYKTFDIKNGFVLWHFFNSAATIYKFKKHFQSQTFFAQRHTKYFWALTFLNRVLTVYHFKKAFSIADTFYTATSKIFSRVTVFKRKKEFQSQTFFIQRQAKIF